MKRLQVFREMRRAYAEKHLGDLAVLKLGMIDFQLHPRAQKAVDGKTFSLENYDLTALDACPAGSLGKTYAEHMRRYGLKPFDISPAYQDLARQHAQGVRYIKTHDLFHVLTGFDTSLAGEIGVLYFTFAQKMYRFQMFAAIGAMIIYPIIAPHKMPAIVRSAGKGWRMGKQAEHLLGIEFERHWNTPIKDIRAMAKLTV